jgi:hypothetical protein
MKLKFIEGTNKQYSIREDGVVIKHYKRQRITNTRMDKIITNNILKVTKDSVDIVINNKPNRILVCNLMRKYFNYTYCKSCNDKFVNDINNKICNNCKIKTKRISANKYAKKQVDLISKVYIAGALKLKKNELTDDLYNHYKANIKIKRLLSEKTGLHIYTFNR